MYLIQVDMLFPFLIGKVLTTEITEHSALATMFPFLIGKVLTEQYGQKTPTFRVSIPYR